MIHRLQRSRPPLTIDQYVYRATLGLPKEERLDAATELRSHLLERVTEYQERGYAREEAEFLAVRGMGDVLQAHPQLWRERLRTVGWPVLALLCVGWLAWYAQREWMPPKEGLWLDKPTPEDTAYLFTQQDAPRGIYQAATLTFPQGTKAVVYAHVASPQLKNGNLDVFLSIKNVAQLEAQNIQGHLPGSYRYQERWLWTSEHLTCKEATGKPQPSVRFFVTAQTLPSRFWNPGGNFTGLGSITEPCNNPHIALQQVTQRLATQPPSVSTHVVPADGEGGVMTSGTPSELKLNHWTVLARLTVDPKQAPNTYGPPASGYSALARGAYIAVMPLDYALPNAISGYSWSGGYVKLTGKGQPIQLPRTVVNSYDIGTVMP